ncbi:MAG TPA: succinate dehydrogenase, hydrophobic membrane anchor protein [Bauldia sp.]|nr:succinate dehydrogenase, hydrophobic membrane anchor protein [Bauldia sp.]
MTTPLARVRHYGSAHEGADHFWRQRLTGAANAILVVCAAVVIAMAVGRPYDEVAALFSSPLVAALFALLFVSAAIHMRIGMQVIVEDYVQSEAAKVVLLAASTFFSVAVAAVAIVALIKLTAGV